MDQINEAANDLMIQVCNVTKSFTQKKKTALVLDNISFNVKRGEIFGIIGKSGAGKSTLLKCLNLLEYPDSGSVTIDGIDLTQIASSKLRQIRQSIGVIFQGFNLLSSKTVFDNIALPLIIQRKHSKQYITQKVTSLLDLVGLTEFAHKYPQNLSGGQKQRVGIARALTTEPKILLSDEATSALDPQTTNSILELLLDINEKLNLTIVLITHQIEVIRKICDKVAIIDGGKIIEDGATIDVILHPKHEATRSLVLEEDNSNYLEIISDYYKFNTQKNAHLVLLSFIGNQTFEPILSKISLGSGAEFSILRGELGCIKKTPFGQLLLEINGNEEQLKKVFALLSELKIPYELMI